MTGREDIQVSVHELEQVVEALPTEGGAVLFLCALVALSVVLVARSQRTSSTTCDAGRSDELARAERVARVRARANALTYVIASIATTASLVGMWPVARAAVTAAGIPPHLVTAVALTVLGLLEGTIVVCGLRARANILEHGETGVDGVGLWLAVGASSIISAAEAAVAAPPGTPGGQQFVTVLVRLAAPVTAGWLWERGLAPERRTVRGDRRGFLSVFVTRIRTALSPGLGDVDADAASRRRAAAHAAHLAEKLRGVDDEALSRRQRWTLRRLRKALRACGAVHDTDDRRYLLDELAASRHALALAHVPTTSPWSPVETTSPAQRPDEKILAVEQPENLAQSVPENPEENGDSVFFPSGREAYTAMELDVARRLFARSAEKSGSVPSINAVAK
ncbi:hypothetical protein [Streptomyces sp. B6B3]|uniref:hypothetical protein n=1 Tax=Streptomyces sp. B6B3 TaxID=3153570 RepID=UPI00325E2130